MHCIENACMDTADLGALTVRIECCMCVPHFHELATIAHHDHDTHTQT